MTSGARLASPGNYGPVAPMVERCPEEASVGGSNPPRSAKIWTCSVVRFCESTARQIEALEASVRFRSGPQYCVVAQLVQSVRFISSRSSVQSRPTQR